MRWNANKFICKLYSIRILSWFWFSDVSILCALIFISPYWKLPRIENLTKIKICIQHWIESLNACVCFSLPLSASLCLCLCIFSWKSWHHHLFTKLYLRSLCFVNSKHANEHKRRKRNKKKQSTKICIKMLNDGKSMKRKREKKKKKRTTFTRHNCLFFANSANFIPFE